jgi:hypothetical protein
MYLEKGLVPFSHAFIGGVCFMAVFLRSKTTTLIYKCAMAYRNFHTEACARAIKAALDFRGQKQAIEFLCFCGARPAAEGIYLAGRGAFGNKDNNW